MKKIAYIIGTRPEIIRSAAILKSLKKDTDIEFKLIHTGQHYDFNMNKVFFDELEVPDPDVSLEVGSGSHAEQTARIMVSLEKIFEAWKPDILAVFGDTNSSLAAALVATKMHIPLAHLEAGCREYEMDMPEEVNRRLIDHCSNVLLPVSQSCANNLKLEKVAGVIELTGDPLYDVFMQCLSKSKSLKTHEKLGIERNNYIVLTLHRDKNVDKKQKLENILQKIDNLGVQVIFPVHPRTEKNIKQWEISKNLQNITMISPLSYFEILNLVDHSLFVITDSGGLQKEVFWCKKPCVTIREHTAWHETVDAKTNFLTGAKEENIETTLQAVLKKYEEIIKAFEEYKNPYKPTEKNITDHTIEILKKYSGIKWETQ